MSEVASDLNTEDELSQNVVEKRIRKPVKRLYEESSEEDEDQDHEEGLLRPPKIKFQGTDLIYRMICYIFSIV